MIKQVAHLVANRLPARLHGQVRDFDESLLISCFAVGCNGCETRLRLGCPQPGGFLRNLQRLHRRTTSCGRHMQMHLHMQMQMQMQMVVHVEMQDDLLQGIPSCARSGPQGYLRVMRILEVVLDGNEPAVAGNLKGATA